MSEKEIKKEMSEKEMTRQRKRRKSKKEQKEQKDKRSSVRVLSDAPERVEAKD